MAIDVFLSVGKTSTPQQEEFVRKIEEHLRDNGLSPHTVGRNDWSFKSPLLKVRALMQQCAGVVIISFERLFIAEGAEGRGGKEETPLTATKLPTVWNQIEAAMAYILNLPLLVIIERGLRNEGLLDRGYDWYVQSVDLDLSTINTKEFQGVFADWKKAVEDQEAEKKSASPEINVVLDPDKVTLGWFLQKLSMQKLVALIGGLISAFATVAYIAYTFALKFSHQG